MKTRTPRKASVCHAEDMGKSQPRRVALRLSWNRFGCEWTWTGPRGYAVASGSTPALAVDALKSHYADPAWGLHLESKP